MRKKINKIKLIVFVFVLFFMNLVATFGQVNMTKIKDATISGSSITPTAGAVLELESNNKGFLTPRLTTGQRDAIPAGNLVDGLLIFNTTTGCFNHWSLAQNIWLSICGTPPPAIFSISPSQCSGIVVNGTYKQGDALTTANYLTIPVTVTQAGNYTISATTNNGYYFEKSGNFPAAGNYNILLPGTGTPNNAASAPGDDVFISLSGISNSCKPKIIVAAANVSYTVTCGTTAVNGVYYVGIPLQSTNKIIVDVNVSTLGFWSINTGSASINGLKFSGTGTFTAFGPQSIELLGTGTPLTSGTNNFTLYSNSITGATCPNIPVTVSPMSYTMNCSAAIPNGTYVQAVALNSTNTIALPINVTATGTTTISTNMVNGISFTSGPISLTTLGAQTVTLIGTGTPGVSGSTTLTVTGAPGGAATCNVNLPISAQPVAYIMTCASITNAGTYAPDIALNASNIMTVPVNVTYVGAYNITTNSQNGVSFSGTGTFAATGAQNVVLTGTGTPTSSGVYTYTISSNSNSSAITCNKSVSYQYRTINVLGLGAGIYQPASGTTYASRAVLTLPSNFSPTGIVPVQSLNIVDGAMQAGNTLKATINTNNIDIIVLAYPYEPDAATNLVLADFVKNKKGVLIQWQKGSASTLTSLINSICGGAATSAATSGVQYVNNLSITSDPILTGPFGNIQGLNIGCDYGNGYYISGLPATATILATLPTDATKVFAFKHNTLGYLFAGDSGGLGGYSTSTEQYNYPAKITGSGTVASKNFGNPSKLVYGSVFYANSMAWAIKYAQINTNTSYVIP